MSSYLTDFTLLDLMKNDLVQSAIAARATDDLKVLQDTLANLQRIRNTPLPFAYQAHLRMSLWYVLSPIWSISERIIESQRFYLFFLPVSPSARLTRLTE